MSVQTIRQQAKTLWTLYTARNPVYMILYLTSRCNFRCPMCFYLEEIKDPNKDEIAFPELRKMSKSMGRMIHLSLTGGEPFLRHDIPEVVNIFVHGNGVRFITIPTNGSLTDQVMATVERLVSDHPRTHFRIPISLDGYPDDHDAIRGAKSFDKLEVTAKALAGLRDRVSNLSVDINTCHSSLNDGKLRGFVDFVADRFDVDNHTVTYVRGNADDETKNASVREYRQLVEDLRRRQAPVESRPFSSILRAVTDYQKDIIDRTLAKDQMYVPCMAGRKMIVVNEKAEVMPCEILNKRMGRLAEHDYSIKRLLDAPQAVDLVKWIRKTKCHCTFECALATSIIYHKASYPKIFWRALNLRGRRQRRAEGRPASRPAANPQLVQLNTDGLNA